MVIQYNVFEVNILFAVGVFMKGFCCKFFLQYEFHVGVSYITPKLSLHKIIDVYPCIDFINKGMYIVQKNNA